MPIRQSIYVTSHPADPTRYRVMSRNEHGIQTCLIDDIADRDEAERLAMEQVSTSGDGPIKLEDLS